MSVIYSLMQPNCVFTYLHGDSFCDSGITPEERVFGLTVGGGMLVLGGLLATRWSDVPVSDSIDFSVTPDRVQIGKTFVW